MPNIPAFGATPALSAGMPVWVTVSSPATVAVRDPGYRAPTRLDAQAVLAYDWINEVLAIFGDASRRGHTVWVRLYRNQPFTPGSLEEWLYKKTTPQSPELVEGPLTLCVKVDHPRSAWEWLSTHRWDDVVVETGRTPSRTAGPPAFPREHLPNVTPDLVALWDATQQWIRTPPSTRDGPMRSERWLTIFGGYVPFMVGRCVGGPLMTSDRAIAYENACVGVDEARWLEFGPPGERPTTEALTMLAALNHTPD